jgi:hypothetical protein
MSDQQPNQTETDAPEKKKISLQEAIKQKLASKKQEQASGKTGGFSNAANQQKMHSQNTKKPNNQRRRTGGS